MFTTGSCVSGLHRLSCVERLGILCGEDVNSSLYSWDKKPHCLNILSLVLVCGLIAGVHFAGFAGSISMIPLPLFTCGTKVLHYKVSIYPFALVLSLKIKFPSAPFWFRVLFRFSLLGF